jgi:hypothetical protein
MGLTNINLVKIHMINEALDCSSQNLEKNLSAKIQAKNQTQDNFETEFKTEFKGDAQLVENFEQSRQISNQTQFLIESDEKKATEKEIQQLAKVFNFEIKPTSQTLDKTASKKPAEKTKNWKKTKPCSKPTIQGFLSKPKLGLAVFQHFGEFMRRVEKTHQENNQSLTDELRSEYIKMFFEKNRPIFGNLWK